MRLAWLTVPALIGPVHGAAAGRVHHHLLRLALDLLDQHSHRDARRGVGIGLYPQTAPSTRRARLTRWGFWLIGPGLAILLSGITLAGLGLAAPIWLAAAVLGGALLVAAYVRHALRVDVPLVDLRLLRLPTFRIAAVGGTLFRLGGGALPFLLPLMFQIGFGLSAFQSGLMTFASGIGAILMKFIAQPILNRFGFRRVLVVNAGISACFLLAPAAFTPETPYLLMVATLFFGGICRSLQFTSINAIAYAEVDSAQMGSATSFNSVLQQLSASIGISIAAFGLEAMQRLYGGAAIDLAHFPAVFLLLAGLSLSSAIWFAMLTQTSGAEILGARPEPHNAAILPIIVRYQANPSRVTCRITLGDGRSLADQHALQVCQKCKLRNKLQTEIPARLFLSKPNLKRITPMKNPGKLVVAALVGMMATTCLGGVAAFAAGTETTAQATAPYAIQAELLKTADQALTTLTHVRSARMALFDNNIELAKADILEATNALTQGEVDLRALRVADTEKPGSKPEFLPFDMSMALTDSFKATKENEAALQKAEGLIQTGDKNAAIEVLRVASVDLNISAALLPEASSIEQLKRATELIDGKAYFDANIALKSIEDSVIVRTFNVDAIPSQGDIE